MGVCPGYSIREYHYPLPTQTSSECFPTLCLRQAEGQNKSVQALRYFSASRDCTLIWPGWVAQLQGRTRMQTRRGCGDWFRIRISKKGAEDEKPGHRQWPVPRQAVKQTRMRSKGLSFQRTNKRVDCTRVCGNKQDCPGSGGDAGDRAQNISLTKYTLLTGQTLMWSIHTSTVLYDCQWSTGGGGVTAPTGHWTQGLHIELHPSPLKQGIVELPRLEFHRPNFCTSYLSLPVC